MRRHLPLACALLTSIAVAGPSAEADPDTSLKSRMGEETYINTGMQKLSTEEKQTLIEWLDGKTETEISPVTIAPAAAATPPAVPAAQEQASAPTSSRRTTYKAPEKEEPKEILSRIVPPFDGWSGKTVFRLENGQVWQQRVEEVHSYSGSDTRVRIKRNFLGFYWLELLADGEKVAVKRVE